MHNAQFYPLQTNNEEQPTSSNNSDEHGLTNVTTVEEVEQNAA